MTSSNLEHRVGRLDNDVAAIYELLGTIQVTQTRHTTRLDEICTTVAGQTQRLESVETKLDQVLEILRP